MLCVKCNDLCLVLHQRCVIWCIPSNLIHTSYIYKILVIYANVQSAAKRMEVMFPYGFAVTVFITRSILCHMNVLDLLYYDII